MNDMTPERLREAKLVGGSPMFAKMNELSVNDTYKRLDANFMAAHWWEVWDALLVSLARIEELEKDPWWRRISRGDIAAELSATFDIGLDVAVRIADWILSPAALAAEESLCAHCGKPESDSKHVRYGPDLDNPVKHEFEAALAAHRPDVLSGEEKP